MADISPGVSSSLAPASTRPASELGRLGLALTAGAAMLILASFALRVGVVTTWIPKSSFQLGMPDCGVLWSSPYVLALILCAGSGLSVGSRSKFVLLPRLLGVARISLIIGAILCALDAGLMVLSDRFTVWTLVHEWWPRQFLYHMVALSLVLIALSSFRWTREGSVRRMVLNLALLPPAVVMFLQWYYPLEPLMEMIRINYSTTVVYALCGITAFVFTGSEAAGSPRQKFASYGTLAWLSSSALFYFGLCSGAQYPYGSLGILKTLGMILLVPGIVCQALKLRSGRDIADRLAAGLAAIFLTLSLLDLWGAFVVQSDLAITLGILDVERASAWFPFALVLSGVSLVLGAAQPAIELPAWLRGLSATGFFSGAVIALVGLYRQGSTALEMFPADRIIAPGLGLAAIALLPSLVGLLRPRSPLTCQ